MESEEQKNKISQYNKARYARLKKEKQFEQKKSDGVFATQ